MRFEFEVGAGIEHYRNPALRFDSLESPSVSSRAVSSQYRHTTLALEHYLAPENGWGWLYAGDAEVRRYDSLAVLNRDRYRFFAGPVFNTDDNSLEFLLAMDGLHQPEAQLRRDGRGLRINWFGEGDQRRNAFTFEQLSFKHDTFNDLYDSRRLSGKFSSRYLLDADTAHYWLWRTGMTRDVNRWSFDELSAKELLLEIEMGNRPRNGWQWSVALSQRHIKFDGQAPGTNFTRADQRYGVILSLGYAISASSRLQCELELNRRSSNDPLAVSRLSRNGCFYEFAL